MSQATIADLLTLHDLDLGALAHKVGVTGEGFTQSHVEALSGVFSGPVSDHYCQTFGYRVVAARGAKVRAALSQPAIAAPLPTLPRILQSADEAPCGSVVKTQVGDLAMQTQPKPAEQVEAAECPAAPETEDKVRRIADLETALAEAQNKTSEQQFLINQTRDALGIGGNRDASMIDAIEALQAAVPAAAPLNLGTVREPRSVAIALLNLAERQPVNGESLFCWLVQESRAWAALER
jgi:hypothetical protein